MICHQIAVKLALRPSPLPGEMKKAPFQGEGVEKLRRAWNCLREQFSVYNNIVGSKIGYNL